MSHLTRRNFLQKSFSGALVAGTVFLTKGNSFYAKSEGVDQVD